LQNTLALYNTNAEVPGLAAGVARVHLHVDEVGRRAVARHLTLRPSDRGRVEPAARSGGLARVEVLGGRPRTARPARGHLRMRWKVGFLIVTHVQAHVFILVCLFFCLFVV
jgi:hypothetical protein